MKTDNNTRYNELVAAISPLAFKYAKEDETFQTIGAQIGIALDILLKKMNETEPNDQISQIWAQLSPYSKAKLARAREKSSLY